MTIAEWLKTTSSEFADALLPTAGLDAEILLAHTINKPRTWLHAHTDDELDPRRRDIADARAQLRLERVPVAYIIGHKEFYGRRFAVSPNVLIPRPESEVLIDLVRDYLPPDARRLVDIGTGSGALGITLKLEYPDLDVSLLDISADALKIATKNATTLQADVRTISSNLLDNYPLKADVIVANLPYVDRTWPEQSPELAYEPELALYTDAAGLALISQLLDEAPQSLKPGGIMVLESDARQQSAIITSAEANQWKHLETRGLGIVLAR